MADSPIQSFAASFRNYGVALGVIVASVPVATQGFDLLPLHDSITSTVTFLTSLASYLGVALVFAIRRHIGNAVFPPHRRVLTNGEMARKRFWQFWCPGLFVVCAIVALFSLFRVMDRSVDHAALRQALVPAVVGEPTSATSLTLLQALDASGDAGTKAFRAYLPQGAAAELTESQRMVYGQKSTQSNGVTVPVYTVTFQSEQGVQLVLASTPSTEVHLRWAIELSYLVMFVGATAAFVWFGMVEYLQGVLGLDDGELLANPYRKGALLSFFVPHVRREGAKEEDLIFFIASYNSEDNTLIGEPMGPFCGHHHVALTYMAVDPTSKDHCWQCRYKKGNDWDSHFVFLTKNDAEMKKARHNAAVAELGELAS
ncbi:MAG: hypothetical protein O7G83_08305 [Proteobacteria bacterium]|nr:hypothetical protein [Pseudomonadota bacterium]